MYRPHCTALHCIAYHIILLHCIVFQWPALYALLCIITYFTLLHCILFYCTALHLPQPCTLSSNLIYAPQGDMATITYLILLVYRLFPFADYRWLTKEMNTNLPLELDFKVEVLLLILSCTILPCCSSHYSIPAR
jgi:hypothetical protein